MAVVSAALLVWRLDPDDGLEVLLVHPGGPYFANKDDGHWSIPKGLANPGEDLHAAASREFEEELGQPAPAATGDDLDLGEVVQRGGKHVRCWARRGDLDVTTIASNTFELEWPPRSGRTAEFPEVDRAGWFSPAGAKAKLNPAQVAFVARLDDQRVRR